MRDVEPDIETVCKGWLGLLGAERAGAREGVTDVGLSLPAYGDTGVPLRVERFVQARAAARQRRSAGAAVVRVEARCDGIQLPGHQRVPGRRCHSHGDAGVAAQESVGDVGENRFERRCPKLRCPMGVLATLHLREIAGVRRGMSGSGRRRPNLINDTASFKVV